MKDPSGSIIYIGKAKDLYKRVSSYFLKNGPRDSWKTAKLVEQISDLDFMITDNETEAFLLESNLIKRYRPVFNIELKDQQRYTYLKITDELFPRLLVARRNRNGEFLGPKGKVYGPFVKGSSKFLTVGLMRKLFKIRVCVRLPKSPCLQYYIKNCDAPCIDKGLHELYLSNVNSLREILDGKKSIDQFAQSMEREMHTASGIGDYERAKEIRDTLYRLNNLRVRQKMEKVTVSGSEEEYIAIARDNRKGIAHVMTLRRSRGVISDRKKFEFDLVADNSLDAFIVQYYSSTGVLPDTLYTNEELESKIAVQAALEKLAGHQIRIVSMSDRISADRKDILSLIMRNLDIYLEQGHSPPVIELKQVLRLDSIPEVIDCFDVSNLGVDISVGACCRFVGGKPSKSGYRKFRISNVTHQDDFAMIGELVRRRYCDQLNDLPDLIVVDGGKGQLSAAISSLNLLGISVPSQATSTAAISQNGSNNHSVECISLAKEREEIYTSASSKPIVISKSNEGLHLLQHVRDEAHRFGLAYNRQLRRL